MTKIEEKIREAADIFAEQEAEIGEIDRDALYKGFYHGAKWALSHQWISVDKALPKDEEYVLVGYNDVYGVGFGVAGYFDEKWYTADDNIKIDKIFIWMPIPPLP